MRHSDVYSSSEEARKKLADLLEKEKNRSRPDFFDPVHTRELYIRGSGGSLRVLHHHPKGGQGIRPVVFLPGWGTRPEGFMDFLRVVSGVTECFYVETREKNSSRLPDKAAAMDMDRNGRDLQEVLRDLGLSEGKDFALLGTCWGSTVAAHALAGGFVTPPTAVLYDPMPRLWFPRLLLRYVVPFVPVPMWNLLRPVGRALALRGMREEIQRKRAEDFINGADLGKWKRAALSIGDYDLREVVPRISSEVSVFTGVPDKIHDQSHYPELTASIPRGRFFYLPVDESDREYLLGLIARELSGVSSEESIPGIFQEFEKKLR